MKLDLSADPPQRPSKRASSDNLTARVFAQIKQDIFDFRLLPGDRFTEGEIAERMQVSRTPVREALYQLEREAHVEVLFRSGWRVRPFDFQRFENLYDVRIVLELAAVKRLCELSPRPPGLDGLRATWLVTAGERERDARAVATLDESFHAGLIEASGNDEMARIHAEITDRIRIIRRLDFTKEARIDATYIEHAKILRALMQQRAEPAQMMLKAHIEESKSEVRKITIHMLHEARREGARRHQG